MQASNSDASAITTAKENALDHWRQTPTLPWLIAALTYLGPQDADDDAAIEQSRKLDATSPGFFDAA